MVKGESVWNLRRGLHQWGSEFMVVLLLVVLVLIVLGPTVIIPLSVVLSAFTEAESAFITGLLEEDNFPVSILVSFFSKMFLNLGAL